MLHAHTHTHNSFQGEEEREAAVGMETEETDHEAPQPSAPLEEGQLNKMLLGLARAMLLLGLAPFTSCFRSIWLKELYSRDIVCSTPIIPCWI